MRAVFVLCFIVLLAALAGQVSAQAPLVPYDNFSSPLIDPAKWIGLEEVDPALPPPQGAAEVFRGIVFGQLNMLHRLYGNPVAENINFHAMRLRIRNPASITTIQAKVTPLAYELKACPTTPEGAGVRIRVTGVFFSAGTSTPGDLTNDVIARFEVFRTSFFTEPANIFRVRARVFRCNDAMCNDQEILNADMGTLALRQSTMVRIRWDKLRKQFLFRRDKDPEIAIVYSWSDDAETTNPSKTLLINSFVSNCVASKTVAFVHAAFDDVFVNP